jgi:hypothetical protein
VSGERLALALDGPLAGQVIPLPESGLIQAIPDSRDLANVQTYRTHKWELPPADADVFRLLFSEAARQCATTEKVPGE